jgi:hypothetical protein
MVHRQPAACLCAAWMYVNTHTHTHTFIYRSICTLSLSLSHTHTHIGVQEGICLTLNPDFKLLEVAYPIICLFSKVLYIPSFIKSIHQGADF